MPGQMMTSVDSIAADARLTRPILPASARADGTDSSDGVDELPEQAQAPLVVSLQRKPSKSLAAGIDRCLVIAARNGPCQVCLVSSFRAHYGETAWLVLEESVSRRFQDVGAETIVLRAGNILETDRDRRGAWARFAAWYPLVPMTIASVFLGRDELDSAIDRVCKAKSGMRRRQLTLLGRNRPLREVLAESIRPGTWTGCVTALARLLCWLQIGRLAGLLLSMVARFHRPLQRWHISTLKPDTVGELLSLYHPLNLPHVALAGYNTGVTHFGWKYPGRTIVSTVASGRLVRVRETTVTVDAGVLLKRVIRELAARGKELYVVPNYSYISLGTTFMVPVHGSGSAVSTLGDSIEQALIYDPAVNRILQVRRGDERFGRSMYNPASGVLVLRLRLRIRNRSRYFVKRSRLVSPSAADIWRTFTDPVASNIEIRKSRAAEASVEISKYYTTPSDGQELLEIPRDSIGRMWDRLEENPVSSRLFHAYVRKCGFHVELFLDEREFAIFWKRHATLPLSKLQLRLVRCDRIPHSPCGDGDRISVDIFMKRRHSARFLSFMKESLPDARYNPGKHSL